MSTIVSAFIYEDRKNCKTLDEYYQYGNYLLKCNVKKVVFLDQTMHNYITQKGELNTSLTHLEVIDKDELYLFKELNNISSFHITDNAEKNTKQYIIVQCLKTEFVSRAIDISPFNSEQFVWVDFGIKHVCDVPRNIFNNYLITLSEKVYSNVRIGGIWDTSNKYNLNILTDVHWFFAGGVFGGSKNHLLLFNDHMKKKCMELINRYHTLTWEVNIWYLIWKENPSLFDIYKCDHNCTLLTMY